MSWVSHLLFTAASRRGAAVALAVAAALAGSVGPVASQDAQPAAAPTPTPIAAIDVSDISDRAAELRRDIERMVPREADTTMVDAAATALPVIETEIDSLQVRLTEALHEPISIRVLKDERVGWALLEGQLEVLGRGLERQSREISRTRSRLENYRAQWRVTLESASGRDDPPAVTRQTREALDAIGRADQVLTKRLDSILDVQARVGSLRSDVLDAVERIDQRISGFGTDLLRPESLPVWRALDPGAHYRFHHEPLKSTFGKRLRHLDRYLQTRTGVIGLQLVIWTVLGLWLRAVRRRHVGEAAGDRTTENVVVQAPFTVALLVAIVVGIPLHTGAPRAWPDVLYIVILAALARLAAVALPRRTAGAVAVLALLGTVHWVASMVPDVHPVDRWMWLGVSVLGAIVIPLVAKPVLTVLGPGSPALSSARSRLVTGVTVILGASAIANLLGFVDLAVVITGGVMLSLYTAAVMWTLTRILDGIVGLVLRAGWARRSRIVSDHGDRVRAASRRLFRLLATALWLIATLDAFLLWTPIFREVRRSLQASFTVGSLTISLGSVLAAVVAVWLAVAISRIVQFFFEEEVASRVELPPGVPATMSRLIHYAILVIGAFLALAAAGIEISQLAIVFGAFGVGIGFGLQNIVNNFISGLILMFERPIRVGDAVTLGTLSGEVSAIGIRASTIRTWDGSEVLVPNGNLIASELINWTLSDTRRRLELPVGVAYGTDPERVIELLVAEMNGHGLVLPDPEPFALFVGFGDSSLNFSARCWCRFSDSLRTASDLHVAFNRALAQAGIEIPFPQRDLHLRSVDSGVGWPKAHPDTTSGDDAEPHD